MAKQEVNYDSFKTQDFHKKSLNGKNIEKMLKNFKQRGVINLDKSRPPTPEKKVTIKIPLAPPEPVQEDCINIEKILESRYRLETNQKDEAEPLPYIPVKLKVNIKPATPIVVKKDFIKFYTPVTSPKIDEKMLLQKLSCDQNVIDLMMLDVEGESNWNKVRRAVDKNKVVDYMKFLNRGTKKE